MDRDRFDALAKLLATSGSRRVTLGALVGVLIGPTAAEAARKRRQNPGNDKDRDRGKDGSEDREREQRVRAERRKGGKRRKSKKKRRGGSGGGQTPPPSPDCCGAESCPDPEPGSTRAGCDFAGRAFAGQDHNGSIFRGIDGREANFNSTDNQGSIFAEACLQGARFRRAMLDGATWEDACLFGADFTGAELDEDDPLFAEARFCNTTMPDGSVNDRDCGRETACCRAELGGGDPECQSAADCGDEACRTKACTDGQCVYTVIADGASPNDECGTNASGHCCEGDCCQGNATACNPLGLCCAPNCAGRECGPDGCGGNGTCGTCQAGQTCDDDSGQCVCTRQSCPDGCCSNGPGNPGACRPGTTVQNCGTGGAECAVCDSGDGCLNQQCTACNPPCPTGAGLRCAANGQCVCDGQSCPDGCCFSDSGGSICLDGRVGGFCGSGGETCVDCGGGANCVGQVCVCLAGLCDGCCENGPGNAGLCRTNTPPVCGVDGAQCTSCPAGAGRTCNAQGQCVCTPQSCPNGCCDDNGLCQPGNTRLDCGTGGQTCARCGAGQSCQNGVCVCTPQSCPNGCCAADGTCQPGDAFQACGTGGNACAGCNDQQTCQDQECVNCGNSTCICTGQSLCTDDGASNLECSGPGDPNACFCYVSQSGQPICGGSVTILEPNGCSSDADCGAGGACVASTGTGPCGANGKPFCVGPCCQPNCAGKQCGPDGCAGNCGTCDGALQCENGQCVSPCTPQNCPNGCCAADGTCQLGTTTGVCGKGGAACQACGAGQGCIGQQCQACFPRSCQDLGAVCGPQPDNCGGIVQCGSCQLGGGAPSCDDGTCVSCPDACPASCAVCVQTPDGTTECAGNAVTFCDSACTSDADCGPDFPRCISSSVERATGTTFSVPDSCQNPAAVGICVALSSCCQADCAGKTCGDDGCGGSCGLCGTCQDCQNGACRTTGQFCGGICCALTGEFCCTDAGAYCCDNSFTGCCQGSCCG